jgi:hypothetical protein
MIPPIVFCAFATITGFAAEHTIDRSQLPPEVEKTVRENSSGASIKGFSVESEGSKKIYEAEMVVAGHSKDLEIAEDGTLNGIEEEVSFDALRPSVQQALRAKAGAGTIVKVESLTKRNVLVGYEAAVRKGSRKSEIQVGPNGEPATRR